ncbi:MAG TPA: TIGR02594 family protein [Xanthobacteraceae bacterium]|nr:TIGR02594 family protein [Xanthobacteraceae bacterium]
MGCFCLATLFLATPGEAKPNQGHSHHHARSHHKSSAYHQHRGYRAKRYSARRHNRVDARRSRVARPQSGGSEFATWMGSRSGSSSNLVNEARRYIGTNPTTRATLWCARFMNMVLERVGHRGTGSDMAKSFASYGRKVSGPQVGAIAVISRRGGGHVGVVSGVDAKGNPIVISGNHGRRVAEAVYPASRVYAYVKPSS